MPSLWSDNYAERMARARAVRARLRRLGIKEGASKWDRLYWRWKR